MVLVACKTVQVNSHLASNDKLLPNWYIEKVVPFHISSNTFKSPILGKQ